jgi:AraC family transcriptional regulator
MIQPAVPQLISEVIVPAFGVEDVIMPARFHMRGHAHDEPHMCVVLDGAFEESGHVVSAGMLRISPAGDTHDIQFLAKGARCFVMTFGRALADDASLPAERRFQMGDAAMPIIHRLRHDLEHGTFVSAELLVLETLARITTPSSMKRSTPPAWLSRIREALDDRPFDPPTTEFLAREAGMHPVYVARVFRAWYGCSLATYARLLRLDRAIRLMMETREPLARIAALAGFADQSHLTRAVRARTGTTPRALRTTKVSRVQDFRTAIS